MGNPKRGKRTKRTRRGTPPPVNPAAPEYDDDPTPVGHTTPPANPAPAGVGVGHDDPATRRWRGRPKVGGSGGAQAPGAEEAKVLRARQRELKRGVRYAGNRRRQAITGAAILAVLFLALGSCIQGSNKATRGEVAEEVRIQMQEQGSDYPAGQAVLWAYQVLSTWATWNEDRVTERATLLAPYLSNGMDANAGWNGRGKQAVSLVAIAPIPEVIDKNYSFLEGTYRTTEGTFRCVTLKVYAYRPETFSSNAKYAFALAGNPAPTSCAPSTGAPSYRQASQGGNDAKLAETLRQQFMPGFFGAWAVSDQATLRQYLQDGLQTVGLGGAYQGTPPPEIEVVRVQLPQGSSNVGDLTVATAQVTVVWVVPDDPQATVTATYNVPMERAPGSTQWFVAGEPVPSVQDASISGSGGTGGNTGGNNTGGTQSGEGLYPTLPNETTTPPPTIAPGG